MNGQMTLYVDQYGNKWLATTVRELCTKIGRVRAARMYEDGPNGEVVHVGYVIGEHWCRAFVPYQKVMAA